MHIIAEIGSNWRDGIDSESRKRASKLIRAASQNGAKIVKFQLFLADRLYRDQNRISSIKNLELPIGWLKELKQEAEDSRMEFLVTPFYPEAVDILENIGIKFYKIASTDITYIPLLTRIALTEKPVMLSTIAGKIEEIDGEVVDKSFDEVEAALEILRPEAKPTEWGMIDYNDVVLMHCVSSYPAPINELNLKRILDLATVFIPLSTGFSSHCISPFITASVVNYGVEYIEVHFDLADKRGIESAHSYTPEMLSQLVKLTKELEEAQDCNCNQTFSDFNARKIFRDPSDWRRPVIEKI